MRAVIQRVGRASVSWEDGRSEIGPGALVLLGVGKGDDEVAARWLAEKCIALRMFGDEEGRMNRSLLEVEGELLVVTNLQQVAEGGRVRLVGDASEQVSGPKPAAPAGESK